jgi:hypothetical protein
MERTILQDVEQFLRETQMTPTRFGREALGDPRLVGDLRRGRELRSPTARRVRDYIARKQA